MNTVLITLNVLGGLAVCLFGMKIMSDGLQKMAGVKMRQMLSIATTNRFAATFSGLLVTSIIQSSSATHRYGGGLCQRGAAEPLSVFGRNFRRQHRHDHDGVDRQRVRV